MIPGQRFREALGERLLFRIVRAGAGPDLPVQEFLQRLDRKALVRTVLSREPLQRILSSQLSFHLLKIRAQTGVDFL